MTYSFIGLGKPIAAVNNLLKTKIKNYRKTHPGEITVLSPGGIFASDLSMAAAFAGENDMCVYMTIEELLKNSDLIFVFLSDKALKNISITLGKHSVKGKIFCHFSPAFTADILDFNSGNTYISMLLPYILKDDDGKSIADTIIAEGYGRGTETLKDVFKMFGIDVSFVTADEKIIFETATTLSKDMAVILKYAARRLIKYSLASHSELSQKFMNLAFDDPAQLNTYNPVDAQDVHFVQRQCSALKSLGIDDITSLYCDLLKISSLIQQSEESEKIMQTAKRTLEQK
jgi:hypothetical protein